MGGSVKKSRMTLLTEMALLIIVVVLTSTLLVSILFSTMLDDIVENNMGKQAMTVAKLTAQNPMIIEAFDDANPSDSIQPISETIRRTSGADYVTVANDKGLRYSNPNPENIGKPTATSNDAVLIKHESIIYRGNGVSGPAIKDENTYLECKRGSYWGFFCRFFTLNNLEQQVLDYKKHIIQLAIIPFLVGIGGAILIARRLKKLISGFGTRGNIFSIYRKRSYSRIYSRCNDYR